MTRASTLLAAAMLIAVTTTALAEGRGTRVVPDQPARVFVMAGFDAACKAAGPVQITVDRQPGKGAVSLREGQETTVQYSLSGKCIGARVKGTGIYYTARAGATGSDTFSVTARIGTSEPATRTFTVSIAGD
jgi:hypothetical protein